MTFGAGVKASGGTVVGQVADHANLFFGGKVSPIELQSVGLKNG